MRLPLTLFRKVVATVTIVLFLSLSSIAQQNRGSLRGLITDELGAAIVGANVILTSETGVEKRTTTNAEGVYTLNGLAPGKYILQATAAGFAPSLGRELVVNADRQTLDVTLRVTIEEKVTVATDSSLTTEATDNANQTIVSGKDLDALPDDPDELAAALQALAGPSIGPSGGQIFIDGFSGGNLPSKDSIR
ncbi:MAG TPA: carboxypeptidase-like regulatory domain-containing protein, partial [Pyrinomonadaceae bacterium]|nr:carboxypeptidase-like regulatory domain-containing protein [Pyrinomonadaceae bacterium]